MFQNVADDAMSAGDAASFIISQLKAFNKPASEASHIIDAVFHWPKLGWIDGDSLMPYTQTYHGNIDKGLE